MAEVRSDSRICIEKDGIKTIIFEGDYESNGYKIAGWKVVTTDWTQGRIIKPRLDVTEHLAMTKMAEGIHKKK